MKSASIATRNARRIETDLAATIQYKIRVGPHGIEQVVGPSDLTSRGAMFVLSLLRAVSFLRPLIWPASAERVAATPAAWWCGRS